MKKISKATKIIFSIYCLLLIWLILFKMTFSFSDILWFQGTRSVNLIPFYSIRNGGNLQIKEVIMNAVVFVPMGIYLKMFEISSKKVFLVGVVGSFALEFIQILFAIGASDITDLITNTLGTVAGVCLYVLLRKMFSNKQKVDRVINGIAAVALALLGILLILLILAN